ASALPGTPGVVPQDPLVLIRFQDPGPLRDPQLCDEVSSMQSRKLLMLFPVLLLAGSCSRDPKVQAQRYLENGNKFFAREKFKEVRDLARGLLTQNPDSFDGRRIQGQLALLDGDAKSAVEEFEQANKTKPFQTDLCLTYFQALDMAGRGADAEKIAREMFTRE